jgi:hypothetical protein
MRKSMKPIALILLLLGPQAVFASWLPLWYDIPARNNPQDPAFSRAQGSIAVTASVKPALTAAVLAPAGWDFDAGGAQGWAADTSAEAGIVQAAASAGRSHDGCCSLACSCAFQGPITSGRARVDLSAGPLKLAGHSLKAWLYVPAGMNFGGGAYARLEAMGGAGGLILGPAAPLPLSAGWIPLKAELGTGSGADSIRSVALRIAGVQSAFYGTLYLDSVSY